MDKWTYLEFQGAATVLLVLLGVGAWCWGYPWAWAAGAATVLAVWVRRHGRERR